MHPQAQDKQQPKGVVNSWLDDALSISKKGYSRGVTGTPRKSGKDERSARSGHDKGDTL